MGIVVRKVQCVSGKHDDKTPSCAVYDDGSGYCFSCTTYFPKISEPTKNLVKEKEDLREKFIYINKLPTIIHRCLEFRYDSRGYYICWPLEDFYKLRLWAPKDDEPRYIGAKGHKKPWFCLKAYKKVDTCVVVEGEINALSIHSLSISSNFDILSPGGVSSFHDTEMKLRQTIFNNYAKILVLADKDKAGEEAVIKFHKLIKPHCLDIRIKLMEKDCNQILVEDGKERLETEILEM